MSSQGQNSTALKAGNTKLKGTTKNSAIGANISKKGYRLKGQVSGTKTSQSEMDSNIVVVDGKVRTPKDLISEKYRQYTDQYLKLLEAKNETDRKQRDITDAKVKSSLNSHNESDIKGSSSNFQDKSEFMESSKSEADSQQESKKQKHVAEKKDPKALTIEDLQKDIPIVLQQTETIFTFFLPSVCFKNDNDKMKLANANYRQYCQKRVGSDNFIARPVQTFNFQHKKMAESVDKPNTSETGVFASAWDIQDNIRQEKKSQFQILQQDIKNNVEKQFNQLLTNPFSCLSLEKQAIQIHSKFPVPGAADYLLKQKDNASKTKKHGLASGNTNTGLAQGSTSNNRQSDSRQNDSSQKKQSSQNNSNSRKGIRTAQAQLEASQQQHKVEQEQKVYLDKLMEIAKMMPSEQQRKLMVNQNLQKMLKYVDRILNSQTYHREYILYRNYPEIQFIKKSPEDDLGRNFKKKKEQAKKQEVKEPLQYLFSFKCKMLQKYSVTSADWNPINKDLLAVTYELVQKDTDSNDRQGINKGYLTFWTLKNPAFPQKIFSSQSRLTCCKFSVENPNLIACGTFDGVVAIYDIRKKDNKPIAENKQSMDKNTNAIWDIQWISKGKGNKGQSLVSISADGRITQWSMKKGLQYTDLMLLKRIAPSNKKDAVQNMNFRFASGLSFEFLKGQSSMYLATTQEGVIYRCSKSYTQQSLEFYLGHNGPIYKVHANPFFHDIFLTCSADWSCKLWNWRQDQSLFTFQSLDLFDEVIDIQWSPTQSTVFASVCKDGRLELWDLEKKNMLDPISIIKGTSEQKLPPKTMVRFCHGAPVLITGDVTGDVSVFRLNRDEQNLDPQHQCQKLMKLIYPNGYKLGNQPQQSIQQKQKKNQQMIEDKQKSEIKMNGV